MSVAIIVEEATGIRGRSYGWTASIYTVDGYGCEGPDLGCVEGQADIPSTERFNTFDEALEAGRKLAKKLFAIET